jgi:hypothetical protein
LFKEEFGLFASIFTILLSAVTLGITIQNSNK